MTPAEDPRPPVVVGVDGSEHSLAAVRWAARDAALTGAPLLLVTALAEPGTAPGVPPEWVATQRASAERRLAEASALAVAAARPAGDVVVRTEIAAATPVEGLLARARTARRLVLGTRGLGELTAGLVGSVSSALLSHAPCPVVVVPGGPAELAERGHVVVGVDGSATSSPAVGAAFAAASARGVPLTAVHSWTDLDLATAYAVDEPHAALGPRGAAAGHELVLAESLAGYQERFPDVAVTRVVVADRPVTALLEQAQDAQLVVVGSHGRGGFTGMLLGSTSRALLHTTPCPLLVVRTSAPG